jgi:hypothetical protein
MRVLKHTAMTQAGQGHTYVTAAVRTLFRTLNAFVCVDPTNLTCLSTLLAVRIRIVRSTAHQRCTRTTTVSVAEASKRRE